MIEYQEQLKLQSYVDGELPTAEAREVADQLAREPGAAALLTELRQTRQALAGFENDLRLPESREFYWSKIQREIQRQEAPAPELAPKLSWVFRLRRLLMPATGLAVVALLALVVDRQASSSSDASVETSLADSGGVVYHDFSAGATFVWLSYPADNEISEEDETGALE